MCGTALRCVAKYLYDNGLVKSKNLKIETVSGIRSCTLLTRNNQVYRVTVDMGKAILEPERIPVKPVRSEEQQNPTKQQNLTELCEPTEGGIQTVTDKAHETVIDLPQTIGGTEYRITCVSMGNPHCTVFTPAVDALKLADIGPLFEHAELFPERVNAEFAEIVDETTVKLRVWERGSGETLACGTGACAAVVAAVLNGYCKMNSDIRVLAAGGEMYVNYNEDRVLLSGDCETVCTGTVII